MAAYTMKKYSSFDVVPGMEIGKDVLNEDGQVILSNGVILNETMIEGLQFWDITTVEIREVVEEQEKPAVATVAKIERSVSSAQQQFSGSYHHTMDKVKKAFETIRAFNEVPIVQMNELMKEGVQPLLESTGVVNYLHMVDRDNEYQFHHSVNVAVMCGVLGKWLGITGAELQELIMAGLLHDIGNAQIDAKIINKPGPLTPEEMKVIRTHTVLGYQMVKDRKSISANIAQGILQHHERVDGTGYPLQLPKDRIHRFAKIIAVADTYDAMTSDRVYKAKVSPFKVVETMLEEMYNKLDPEICTVFLNNVRDYFVGNIVELSDGRQAEVVYISPITASRPTVRTADGEFIDLEKNKNISIMDLVQT
jgi:putative nucleotidyltransferase with HDIG domain